jgi:hypothetical protein
MWRYRRRALRPAEAILEDMRLFYISEVKKWNTLRKAEISPSEIVIMVGMPHRISIAIELTRSVD